MTMHKLGAAQHNPQASTVSRDQTSRADCMRHLSWMSRCMPFVKPFKSWPRAAAACQMWCPEVRIPGPPA